MHQALKGIKLGSIKLVDGRGAIMNIKVTWDEQRQLFSATENRAYEVMTGGGVCRAASSRETVSIARNTAMAAAAAEHDSEGAIWTETDGAHHFEHGAIRDPVTASTVAQSLHAFENKDRESRRVTQRSLEEQGAGHFINNLLSCSPAPNVKAVHDGGIKKMNVRSIPSHLRPHARMLEQTSGGGPCSSLKAGSNSSSAEGAMKLEGVLFKERPVLIYGFQEHQRTMKGQLEGLGFTTCRTMFMYNQELDFEDSFGFQGYCNFLDKASSNQLKPQSGKIRAASSAATSSPIAQQEVELWANYLSSHVGVFNFSKKLETLEQRVHFFLKNYTDIKFPEKIDKFPEDIKSLIEDKDWPAFVEYLSPVFDLLARASEGGQLNENLMQEYERLSEDQQAALDCMVTYAFFRKTSKLGLHFARDNDITVVSVLKIGDKKDGEVIKAINDALEIDPAYYSSPQFRLNKKEGKQGVPAAKSITLSEIAEAGRMMQQMNPSDKKLRYVLLREISTQMTRSGTKKVSGASGTGVGASGGASASAARISSQEDDL
ncbi:MAG: hypothetical protein K2W97_07070 [Chthoniobacterales bacterium]|nr:hypothetical protein [Chthoniobacterales bacterium]